MDILQQAIEPRPTVPEVDLYPEKIFYSEIFIQRRSLSREDLYPEKYMIRIEVNQTKALIRKLKKSGRKKL